MPISKWYQNQLQVLKKIKPEDAPNIDIEGLIYLLDLKYKNLFIYTEHWLTLFMKELIQTAISPLRDDLILQYWKLDHIRNKALIQIRCYLMSDQQLRERILQNWSQMYHRAIEMIPKDDTELQFDHITKDPPWPPLRIASDEVFSHWIIEQTCKAYNLPFYPVHRVDSGLELKRLIDLLYYIN